LANSNIQDDIAGGPVRHVPVMLHEVLQVFEPVSGQTIIDGTFGAGGYSSALLELGAQILAIDRDPEAISGGKDLAHRHGSRLALVKGDFANLDVLAEAQGFDVVDGIVLDIGISSMQIDEGERGFSFMADGPLDMRMSQQGVSAADVVNHAARGDLTRIIGIYGEERQASKISSAIVEAREAGMIKRTGQLEKIVSSAVGGRGGSRIHPATRTFQGLRIFVNQELEQLGIALFAAARILKAGGKLAVVTFHSLEDRIVKRFFQNLSGEQQGSRHLPMINHKDAIFETGRNSLLKVSESEAERNPRARSAKLRHGVRTDTRAPKTDLSIFGLPRLPDLTSLVSAK